MGPTEPGRRTSSARTATAVRRSPPGRASTCTTAEQYQRASSSGTCRACTAAVRPSRAGNIGPAARAVLLRELHRDAARTNVELGNGRGDRPVREVARRIEIVAAPCRCHRRQMKAAGVEAAAVAAEVASGPAAWAPESSAAPTAGRPDLRTSVSVPETGPRHVVPVYGIVGCRC